MDVLFQTGTMAKEGYLTVEEADQLDEIQDVNPLLFDRRAGSRSMDFASGMLPVASRRPSRQPMANLLDRITIDAEQCGGRPCIRGMRIRVIDVLDLLASGLTAQQVLEELPDLVMEDIQAALRYASQRLDHPVVAA
jgi:uncharacterized protein (DUF433 family)